MMRRRVGRLGAAGLLLVSVFASTAHATPARSTSACDWPMYGHDAQRTFSTSCSAAPSSTSVTSLRPSWYMRTTDVVTATPSIVGGAVYVGDWAGTFYAFDLATGRQRWSTVLGHNRTGDHVDHHQGGYGSITGSAAVADIHGRRTVFVGGGGSMYALDASRDSLPDSRRVLWRTDIDPVHPTSDGEVESSPVLWKDAPGGALLIFGSDANQDSGYLGEGLWALRAETGKVVWHFNAESYTGKALYGCSNVWSSPALALDPTNADTAKRAVLYYGSADCPDNSPRMCPADNTDPHCPAGHSYDYSQRWQPFADAITAISAVTGQPIWAHSVHARNNLKDDDFGASAQLFTLPGGREVVGEGNKDGLYYVLDRHTGATVWQRAEQGNGNIQKSFAIGGFLGATAVLPVSGVPHVFGGAAIDTPLYYDEASDQTKLQPPATLAMEAQPFAGFSGATGATSWRATQAYTYGATSAANGVVYSGSLDGLLRAYNASSGQLLWSFPLGAPISSGAAISGGSVVIGAGTSDTDAQFKTCDNLPAPLSAQCKGTALNTAINPLSKANGVWAFATG